MRQWFLLLSLGSVMAFASATAQQSKAAANCQELPRVPDPPKVTAKIRGEFLHDKKTLIQDVYLQGSDGSQSRAYIVRPRKPATNPGAVLFVHWLGEPPDNDREEFFADAIQLADNNVVSLLVEA